MSITMPRHCVFDASALIKYVIDEEETLIVEQIVDALLNDDEAMIYVPDLLFIECANILWKKVRRGEVDAKTAEKEVSDLTSIELDSTPTADLMTRALQLACAHGISAYDACYLALAERLSVPLLTADDRLIRQLAGTPYLVLSLSAFKQTTE